MNKLFPIALVILLLIPYVNAEILEVCPNPYNPNAEYVKVRCNTTCTLSDGEGNITVEKGVHYVAKNSSAFMKEFGFRPYKEFVGRFALSNNGETLYLYDGKILDVFKYGKAKRGEIFTRNGTRFEGWTDFKPVSDYVEGEVILTPSNFVFDADTIVSYTFTTDRYVKGNYTLYLDANPAGGIPANEVEISRDHETHFLKAQCYRFFHWKFGLKGDDVVITTENWKWDKKGFIVHFRSEKISDFLRKVIEHDKRYSSGYGRVKGFYNYVSLGGKGKVCRFEGNVTVFVMPDYNPILDAIKGAKRRLYIMAPYVKFDIYKMLRNRSCEVKIFTADKNFAEFMRDRGFDVVFDKNIHGKLVIADDKAIITSANFDEYGFHGNREVGVVLEGDVVDCIAESLEKKDDYTVPAIIVLCLAVASAYIWLRLR